MRKRYPTIQPTVFLAIALITTNSVFAQEDESSGSKFGLGVSVFNINEYLYEFSEPIAPIYLTFDIGDKFRLEPIVGFSLRERFSQLSLLVGAFRKAPISKFNLLYGGRIGYSGIGDTGSEMFIVAPAIGGEYYFIRNFSIGSEIQLRGMKPKAGDFVAVTHSSFIARFYF
tara:strand:+ start:52679 stop:53191 length:513 start_codon:yes stop_codon:yes gene_type:complete